MSNVRKEKQKQLGMNPSTANARLRKSLLFHLTQQLDLDWCYQCGEKINNIEDFSIEHKIPWLHSSDPQGLFFDVNNIAFSHLNCNISNARNGREKEIVNGMQTCSTCGEDKSLSEYWKSSECKSGYRGVCKDCKSKQRSDK